MKPVLRCSELDRVLSCPGSRVLSELVAPRVGNEGAAGTRIHGHIAYKLEGSHISTMGEPESLWLGNPFDKWIADFCIREVRDNLPDDWSLECEGEYAYEFDDFILTGHPDAVAINPDVTEAKGWDYKTGTVAVDPAEVNEQVLGYIVLLLRAYPTLRKITFYIVQPRNDEDEGFKRVSEVTLTFDGTQAYDFLKSFEARVTRALQNSNEVDSGRKQCRFCPVSVQCPAINADMDQAIAEAQELCSLNKNI